MRVGGAEFRVVCCCCCTVVAHGNVTKTATEREVETHGCRKLPKGKPSESMEACLAEILFAELKAAGFECCMANITLDGDSKTAAIVKRIFPDCKVWDCFSHMSVNFRKRLTDLGNHKVGKDGPTAWFESHRADCPKRRKLGGGDCAAEWDCILIFSGHLFGWRLSRNLSNAFYQVFTPEACATPELTTAATTKWGKEVDRIMRCRQGLASADQDGAPLQMSESQRREKGEFVTCPPLVSGILVEIERHLTRRIPRMIMPGHDPSVQAYAEMQHAKGRTWNAKSSQPTGLEHLLRGSLSVLDGCFVGFLSHAKAQGKDAERACVDCTVQVHRAVEAKEGLSVGVLLGEGAVKAIMLIRRASVAQSKCRRSPKGQQKHAETKQKLKVVRFQSKDKDACGKGIGLVQDPAKVPPAAGKDKKKCVCGAAKAVAGKPCKCGHDGNPACKSCLRPGHASIRQFSLCLAAKRNKSAGKPAMDASKAREDANAEAVAWESEASKYFGNFCWCIDTCIDLNNLLFSGWLRT